MFCQCNSPDPRDRLCCRRIVCIRYVSAFRFRDNDVKIRQRCEELAMDFAARVGGKDDFDMVELRGDQQGTRRYISVQNSKAAGES